MFKFSLNKCFNRRAALASLMSFRSFGSVTVNSGSKAELTMLANMSYEWKNQCVFVKHGLCPPRQQSPKKLFLEQRSKSRSQGH